MVKQTPTTHASPSTAAVSENFGVAVANDTAPVPEISIFTPDFGLMATVTALAALATTLTALFIFFLSFLRRFLLNRSLRPLASERTSTMDTWSSPSVSSWSLTT